MPFDMKTLLDQFQFTPEERAQAEALLTPKAAIVERTFMAQSDYSRSKDELAKIQARVTKQEETLAAEYETVAAWDRKIQETLGVNDSTLAAAKLNQLLAEKAAAVERATVLEAELRKQAAEYGFTATLPTTTQPNPQPTHQPTNQPVDTSQFLKRNDLQNEMQAFPFLAAEIHDLSVEHQRLFGVPLPNSTEIVSAALASAKEAEKYRDPSRLRKINQVWEEKFNVPAKRAELAATAETQRVEARVQEELTKRASQSTSPIPNTGIPGSPLLNHQFKPVAPDAKLVPVGAGSERRGVDAALKNFGTYYANNQ